MTNNKILWMYEICYWSNSFLHSKGPSYGRDRMVVGFKITYAISVYHH
jgi:hypothetical protein